MSRARCPGLRARTVIQASAQPLWQGTPLAGDVTGANVPEIKELLPLVDSAFASGRDG